MKKPFSILDLVCDEEGNLVKTEIHEYIKNLEGIIQKVKIWLNGLGYSMSPETFIEKRYELECILEGREYDPE
ncbi:MAG TPA: hypothetical protein VMW50_03315 [Dehalococcoidia bacterium]|nr:hypothetical protein [Dehalococcoidia bacterium]